MDPSNPLGASNAPEIAKLYAASYGLQDAKGLASAKVSQAQDEKDAADAAAKLAAQKEADMSNFKAYKIVKKGDGGYDFYDPNGQQVDIATLAQRTGVKPSDVLADSENPIDVQYVNDYKNLQGFIQAVLSGDTKTKDAYVKAKPELKKFNNKNGINDLIMQFRRSYQRYYTPRSVDPNAWGARVPGSPVIPTSQNGSSYGGSLGNYSLSNSGG